MKGFKKTVAATAAVAMLVTAVQVTVPMKTEAKTKINKKKVSLVVGEVKKLKLTGANGTVTWKSSKKKVAAVDKNGVVTAKKAGSAKITAKNKGKKYICTVKVSKLTKKYATVNGKKVKVGKKVSVSWSIQSDKGISHVTEKMQFNKKGLTITNHDDLNRFKVWWDCDTQIDDYNDDETNSVYDLYKLRNLDKERLEKDPTDIAFADVDCKKAKVIDTAKFKVNKSGNYKIVNNFSFSNMAGEEIKKTDYTLTETVK